MGTLTKSTSSGEGEMDQGVTWPPWPPPRVSSSHSWGMGSWQMGPCLANIGRNASERWASHPLACLRNILLLRWLLTVRGRKVPSRL
jgi:hypothetical protein